jgi:hypothetical protein
MLRLGSNSFDALTGLRQIVACRLGLHVNARVLGCAFLR